MATLTINGRKVTVDDGFLNLSPEQQEATVNEIASSFPSQSDFTGNVDPWVAGRADLIESARNPNGLSDASDSVIRKGLPWGDEIAGTLMTPVQAITDWAGGEGFDLGRSFDRSIGLQRELQRRSDERSPIASTVGGLAGGTLLASRLSPASLSVRVAPATLLGKMGVGAAEGAIGGAIYGAGEGEGGITDRLPQAGIGAAVGGALGGAVPLVASGVSSAYRNIADRATANSAASKAGVDPDVARLLSRTLSADDTLGSVGFSNMSRAGNEAMLADAGQNAQSVLDTAIQRGGPGATLAQRRIGERVSRDSQALSSALDNALGSPEGVTASRSAIREGSRTPISQAYDTAYGTPIDYSSELGKSIEDMVKNRVPGSVINQANRLMQLEGNQSKQLLARFANDGSYVLEQLPDVRQVDYITRALNQAAESGEGAGALGGQTTIGRAYQNLARDLRSAAREAVPEYGQALNLASDPIRRSQAVEAGSRVLSPSVKRDQVAELVKGASDAEKSAMAQGIRSQIDDTIASVRRTVADGNTTSREAYQAIRDLSSRSNRDKLSLIIGEIKAKPLFEELDRIAQSFNLQGSVAQNSKTFARQATNEAVTGMTEPGVIGRVAQGEPLNAGKRIIQALTGQTPEALTAKQDRVYSSIADLLTQPAQTAIPVFNATQKFAGELANNQVTANEIARLLMQGRNIVYPASGAASGEF